MLKGEALHVSEEGNPIASVRGADWAPKPKVQSFSRLDTGFHTSVPILCYISIDDIAS